MEVHSRLALLFAAGLWLSFTGASGADEPQPVSVRAAVFSPDGHFLAVGFGTREQRGGLLVWDVSKRAVAQVREFPTGVSSLAFSPDGAKLALANYDHAPQLLRWPSLERELELAATRRGPVAFSPDGSLLATGSEDRSILCLDLRSQTDGKPLTGHRQAAYTIAFSPDGGRIASAAQEGVRVWDVASGQEQRVLLHGSYLTSSALFSPDGRWIMTGGWEGTTRIWNSQTGALRARLSGTGGVDRIAYSPQSRTLAVSGTGSVIALYRVSFDAPSDDAKTRIESALARLDDEKYAVRQSASADLEAAGFLAEAELARAAAGSPSAEVRIRARRARQAITSQPQARLHEHSARIRCLGFSPDGAVLASGGDDGQVHLWDVSSGKTIGSFVPARLAQDRR